jgi:hypothetical protein
VIVTPVFGHPFGMDDDTRHNRADDALKPHEGEQELMKGKPGPRRGKKKTMEPRDKKE